MRCVTVATCQLNQWALDFDGNSERILKSIELAATAGASYRLGPELEITGYGCNDHFHESDTVDHAMEVLAMLIEKSPLGMIVDVGTPFIHQGARYNCRVLYRNKKILLIRPKMHLAMDGNYREGRWFTRWMNRGKVTETSLPKVIRDVTGAAKAPFGDGYVALLDTAIGVETCEELFTPESPHIPQSLNGVEIFGNGSGSHHELRKLNQRLDLIRSGTKKTGGLYLYANQQGCDGERVYYDGCAMIVCNGELLAQASQFSLSDVEVLTATVDLDTVTTYRTSIMSRSAQSAEAPPYDHVDLNVEVTRPGGELTAPFAEPRIHSPPEEIALGPACYLWDYLRRTGLSGYFLPLSGGIDSSSTACIVASMCHLVYDACAAGEAQVLADLRRITKQPDDWVPSSPQEIAGFVFYTAYLGTRNSGDATRGRSKGLAVEIGSVHMDLNIDAITDALVAVFTTFTGFKPSWNASTSEDLALQNIQARVRMVTSYMIAMLGPMARGRSGGLLVLGSGNVDEALVGYLTKYDCSSADINPIGGICKTDLREFIQYSIDKFGFATLQSIFEAPPTAELRPTEEGEAAQTDEDDLGMTYAELTEFGKLRKIFKCGPISMFHKLQSLWSHLSPEEVAGKVKRFFVRYAQNRHKTTVLTPAYHCENYTPDDNRFDLRPFLYNSWWPWQFRKLDEEVRRLATIAAVAPAAPTNEPKE